MKEQFGLLKREPARIVGGILAIVAALGTFGILGADKAGLIAAIGAAVVAYLGVGEGLRPLVVSPATHAAEIAESTVEVAHRLNAEKAGPAGIVTLDAENIATELVAAKAGVEPSLAQRLVAKAKAKIGPRPTGSPVPPL